jgi:hypothetical protein
MDEELLLPRIAVQKRGIAEHMQLPPVRIIQHLTQHPHSQAKETWDGKNMVAFQETLLCFKIFVEHRQAGHGNELPP